LEHPFLSHQTLPLIHSTSGQFRAAFIVDHYPQSLAMFLVAQPPSPNMQYINGDARRTSCHGFEHRLRLKMSCTSKECPRDQNDLVSKVLQTFSQYDMLGHTRMPLPLSRAPGPPQ
jgi:hypothetical protein